ncbi:MAG: RsmD family RNA methyltransferase [Alphaproteobacteria bacterium]|nr:RsmD family RNA methyltransferase [Alphaproteobacteria bacterium]
MKITGGSLKGRVIPGRVPPGVRPTPARVREALFSMLGQELDGVVALDPFCGSGLLSFEALSRGAAASVLLDANPRVVQQVRAAARALGLSDRVTARVGRFPKGLPVERRFDLILLDPPYALDPGPILAAVAPLARGLVVLETAARTEVIAPEGLRLVDRRRYGDTALTLLEAVGAPAPAPPPP